MADEVKVKSTSRDLSVVPTITFGFVEDIVRKCSKSDGAKEITKGYKYFSEKYVTDVRVYAFDGTDGCLVRAKCFRSQKKNETPHDVEVVIKKGPVFGREDSKCSCAIGTSGSCGHIVGLLYSLAHMKASNLKAVPTDVAKTSLPQTWHIPRGEKIGRSASTDVTVMGYSPSNPRKPTKGIKSTLYNPINTECLPLEELCSALSNIDKSCLFLSVVDPEHQQKDVGTKFGNFPKGSSLATQQKLHSDYMLNIMDAEDFPPLPVRNVMRNSVSVVLDHSRTLKLESLSISEVQASEIEEATRLQSEDPKWHKIRQDRITASVAGDIVRRRKDPEPLVARLKTSRKVLTSAMRHGLACEATAALAYVQAMDEEVNIYPCGVVISPWSPWLAATPDRKVFCPSLDPPHGLLEIKCPVNSLADCVYLSKDENSYHLKETHKYFHQIMTHLGVTGLKWCHFFVWTPEESHLELLRFDADIWQEMKEKMDLFFFNHFLI
uniref:SWIM-type domain-containing protein n=1 Tax=Magallana gigas TaxID=29159 RepID=A0A8W8NUK7_MAGGI